MLHVFLFCISPQYFLVPVYCVIVFLTCILLQIIILFLRAVCGFHLDYPTVTHSLTAEPIRDTTFNNTVVMLIGYICISSTPRYILNSFLFLSLAMPRGLHPC